MFFVAPFMKRPCNLIRQVLIIALLLGVPHVQAQHYTQMVHGVVEVDIVVDEEVTPDLQEKVRLRKRERMMFPKQHKITYTLKDTGTWTVTRYYTPVEGQERYLNGWKVTGQGCSTKNLYYNPIGSPWKGSYTADICMQGQNDHFTTADGTNLAYAEPFTVLACPRDMLGRKFIVEGFEEYGVAVCRDTGGAIVGRKIDLWVGVGQEGIQNYIDSQHYMNTKKNTLVLTEIL